MNRALIDTDILSYFLKGDDIVVQNINRYLTEFDYIEISLITYYEIISGLSYKGAQKQLEIFNNFVSKNIVITLTEKSCKISADIYSILRTKGELIDDIDLLIAGVAMDNEMTLVTNNENHFGRIEGLKIENWKTSVL